MCTPFQTKLARILSGCNTVLTIGILLGCIYILLLPFMGTVQSQVKRSQDTTQGLVYKTHLAPTFQVPVEKLKEIPKDNRLVIPKILVDGPISEGDSKDALERGYWRRTPTVDPTTPNNMVIAGHRNIYYWNLYDFDKLVVGDFVTLYWQEKEYNYRITKIFEVKPEAVEIEAPTHKKQLTIYTCTPILTAEKRLVLIAEPLT